MIEHIDELDRKILNALQSDGRLTNSELSDLVGISPSQCSRRKTALEDAGIISGYHAKLEAKRVGIGLTSMISVTLANHDEKNAERFRILVKRLPNVLRAFALTGEMDYLIMVVTKDLDELADLVNKTLLPHDAVMNVKTAITLETLKDTTVLPV